MRRGFNEAIIFACNFTPVPRERYTLGVPEPGFYKEVLNSDSAYFGGSNMGNQGGVYTSAQQRHGRPCQITITLPPLAVLAFKLTAA